jgi:hypothetical protein
MIKPAYILLLLLAAGMLLLASCETDRDPCLLPRTSLFRANAYTRGTDTATAVRDSFLPSPVFTALTAYTPDNSFIQLSSRNKFAFQLSDLNDVCQWVLQPDTLSPVRDTLTFYYRRQLSFLSNACGYTYFYNIDSVTTSRNAIDSVQLGSRDVTSNASVENLRIYF